MNGIDYFHRGHALAPGRPCLVDLATGRQHTYADVALLTGRVAQTLLERGYDGSSKIGVLALNDPVAFSAALGVIRSGATWLSINARNAAADIGRQLAAFDCSLLFYQEQFAASVSEIAAAAPQIKEFICIEGRHADNSSLDEWLTTGGLDERALELVPDPERVFAIQATGGTTGLPKGVVWTDRYLESVVAGLYACIPLSRPLVYLVAAPLTHAAGLFAHYMMANGGTCVLMPTVDLGEILAAIPKYGVTHLFLPPTVIYGLLNRPDIRDHDYSSVEYLIYGASPMAAEKIMAAVSVFGPVVCQMYGQTETGLPVTYLSPTDHFVDGVLGGDLASPKRLSSCGRATPLVKVAIMDDEDNLLPAGEVGEIVVQGSGLSPRYYDETDAMDSNRARGWHRTGDVGQQDEDGYLTIVDRTRDIIITGGFNVYSAEVERVILSHPQIQECAVIGIPHEKWGESVIAVVERSGDGSVTANELIELCRAQLGPVKAPKRIDFVAALPRTPAGKVLKREVRAGYWADLDRNVH